MNVNRLSFISLALSLAVWHVQPAMAQTGIHKNELSQDISFQVESSSQIENDEMQALLAIEDEGRDPTALANKINQIMANSLKILKKERKIYYI